MISVDNYLNETTRHAHVLLPGLSPLEQAHHDDLLWSFAVGSAARYSPPIFPPTDGRPHEWEILIRLAGACLGQPAGEVDVAAIDDGFFDVLAMVAGPRRRRRCAPGYDAGGPERLLDLTLRTGPFGDRYGELPDGLTLEKVKAAPHGIDLGPMVPRLDEVLTTPDGQVVLAPPYITADLPRLADRLDRPSRRARAGQPPAAPVEQLVDAQRPGAGEGPEPVHAAHPPRRRRPSRRSPTATSPRSRPRRAGSRCPVEVTDAIAPGVVSLPHGWGHDRPGARLSVAREHAGINSNVLSPGTFVDVISGNAAVNGIPVTVRALSGAGAQA